MICFRTRVSVRCRERCRSRCQTWEGTLIRQVVAALIRTSCPSCMLITKSSKKWLNSSWPRESTKDLFMNSMSPASNKIVLMSLAGIDLHSHMSIIMKVESIKVLLTSSRQTWRSTTRIAKLGSIFQMSRSMLSYSFSSKRSLR